MRNAGMKAKAYAKKATFSQRNCPNLVHAIDTNSLLRCSLLL